MYTQNELTSSQTFHAKQITDPVALPVWMTLFATYRFEAVDQRGALLVAAFGTSIFMTLSNAATLLRDFLSKT